MQELFLWSQTVQNSKCRIWAVLLYLPDPYTWRPNFPSSLPLSTLLNPWDCQYGLWCVTKPPDSSVKWHWWKRQVTNSEHSIKRKHILGPSIFLFWSQSQASRRFSSAMHVQIFAFSGAFVFCNHHHQSFLLSCGRSWSAQWYPTFTMYSPIKWLAPHFSLSLSSDCSIPSQIKWRWKWFQQSCSFGMFSSSTCFQEEWPRTSCVAEYISERYIIPAELSYSFKPSAIWRSASKPIH